MPYCDMAEITRCNGYRGDYDTYFCGRDCMRMNNEAPRGLETTGTEPRTNDERR